MRTTLLAATILATAGAASAQTALSIPLSAGASIDTVAYSCADGSELSVQYVNSGANALAIFELDGEQRIFANVVSGSGAKYSSGSHVWWTKGDTATLENEMQENSLQECKSQEPAASQ
ncbi:MliC family protein [Sulfitobacter sp. F26169L]|uniref:MliC family protein n=1 Tax=Sulfitobacter sp. F26169L TaxID=2996015 RepID=UPI002260BE51|nr:MliC family protein [Sulfitobacter sp. F26169L]MCX7567371.1 MliC family protein [Sulfitobacter sp. F26169L]